MESVLFGFVKEYGVVVSIVVLAALVLYKVAPEWVKARIENEKAQSLVAIEKIKAEAETIRRTGEAVSTSIPAAMAELGKIHSVGLVQTHGRIAESAADIKAHVSQELDKRMEAKVDGVVSMLLRKPCEHQDHSPNTERASTRGAQPQS